MIHFSRPYLPEKFQSKSICNSYYETCYTNLPLNFNSLSQKQLDSDDLLYKPVRICQKGDVYFSPNFIGFGRS